MAEFKYVDLENLVLSKNGLWLSNGTEVTHEQTCRAFFKNIGRDDEGYFIQIGKDFKRFTVEDTAYFVVRIEGDPSSGYELILSDESREKLNSETLKFQSPDRLTCLIKGGIFEARFLRKPYTELLLNAEGDGPDYFVVLTGKKILLQK